MTKHLAETYQKASQLDPALQDQIAHMVEEEMMRLLEGEVDDPELVQAMIANEAQHQHEPRKSASQFLADMKAQGHL